MGESGEGGCGTWPPDAEDYQILEQIGRGTSATVHKALCISRNELCAIKIIPVKGNRMSGVIEELVTMSRIRHPNLIHYHTFFYLQSHNKLYIVMPLFVCSATASIEGLRGKLIKPNDIEPITNSGTGNKVEDRNDETNKDDVKHLEMNTDDSMLPLIGIPESALISILYDVLKALDYLHNTLGVVHRDIKGSNILLADDGSAKVSDMGVVGGVMEDGQKKERRTLVGSPCWMAPEVIDMDKGYDEKVDIWSLGITALELASGEAPYCRLTPVQAWTRIVKYPPPSLESHLKSLSQEQYIKTFSPTLGSFIACCLQRDPSLRPSAKDLLEHELFINFNRKHNNRSNTKLIEKHGDMASNSFSSLSFGIRRSLTAKQIVDVYKRWFESEKLTKRGKHIKQVDDIRRIAEGEEVIEIDRDLDICRDNGTKEEEYDDNNSDVMMNGKEERFKICDNRIDIDKNSENNVNSLFIKEKSGSSNPMLGDKCRACINSEKELGIVLPLDFNKNNDLNNENEKMESTSHEESYDNSCQISPNSITTNIISTSVRVFDTKNKGETETKSGEIEQHPGVYPRELSISSINTPVSELETNHMIVGNRENTVSCTSHGMNSQECIPDILICKSISPQHKITAHIEESCQATNISQNNQISCSNNPKDPQYVKSLPKPQQSVVPLKMISENETSETVKKRGRFTIEQSCSSSALPVTQQGVKGQGTVQSFSTFLQGNKGGFTVVSDKNRTIIQKIPCPVSLPNQDLQQKVVVTVTSRPASNGHCHLQPNADDNENNNAEVPSNKQSIENKGIQQEQKNQNQGEESGRGIDDNGQDVAITHDDKDGNKISDSKHVNKGQGKEISHSTERRRDSFCVASMVPSTVHVHHRVRVEHDKSEKTTISTMTPDVQSISKKTKFVDVGVETSGRSLQSYEGLCASNVEHDENATCGKHPGINRLHGSRFKYSSTFNPEGAPTRTTNSATNSINERITSGFDEVRNVLSNCSNNNNNNNNNGNNNGSSSGTKSLVVKIPSERYVPSIQTKSNFAGIILSDSEDPLLKLVVEYVEEEARLVSEIEKAKETNKLLKHKIRQILEKE